MIQQEEYMRDNYYNYIVSNRTVSEMEAQYVGLWQYEGRETGSGFSNLYLLLQDNTFVYQHSQYPSNERLRYLYGDWIVKEDTIQFTVKCKSVIEGGAEVAIPEYGSEIQGGYLAFYFYKPEDFETVVYPLQSIEIDKDNMVDHMAIGDDEYWAMSHNVEKNGKTPYWIDPYREGMLFRFREICQMYGFDYIT